MFKLHVNYEVKEIYETYKQVNDAYKRELENKSNVDVTIYKDGCLLPIHKAIKRNGEWIETY